MILEVGKNNIRLISYDGGEIGKLVIHRNTISGPVYIPRYDSNIIKIGRKIQDQQISINCTTEIDANNLLNMILNVLNGSREEKLNRIIQDEN